MLAGMRRLKDTLGTGLPGPAATDGAPGDQRRAEPPRRPGRRAPQLGRARRRLGAARARARGRGALHRPPGRLCRCAQDRRRHRRGDGRDGRRPAPRRAVRGAAGAAARRGGGDRAAAAAPRVVEQPPHPPRHLPWRRRPRSATSTSAPLPLRTVDRRPAWRRVLPTALVAAAVAAVLSLAAWNVVVSGDRDTARATAAEQSAMLDGLLAPGRVAVAPVTQDGETVATVVARDDRRPGRHLRTAGQRQPRPGLRAVGHAGRPAPAAGDVRRGHSPDGPADRRLGGDRARRLLRVRDQHRAGSGGAVVPDGRHRAGR